MGATKEAITALLAKYNDALIASNTDAVTPLYAEDGVFMPPYSPSAVGAEALRKAYDAVFKAITLNVYDRRDRRVSARLGLCTHEFCWNHVGSRYWHQECRGKSGALHLQKGQ